MGASIISEFGSAIDSIWVGYDSTIGLVGGPNPNGQDHYTSRQIGKANLLEKARATEGWLIFGGYSQGAGIVWELMQEIYAGNHPDLWPRVLTSVYVSNPFRPVDTSTNTTTFVVGGTQAEAFSGWGVANLLGTGISPRIPEINLVNPTDMICNAAPDSWLRAVADFVEYMEFNEGSLVWGQKLLENVASINWVAAVSGWTDINNQIKRIQNSLREIVGYASTGKHVCYNQGVTFPVTQADNTTGSLNKYVGRHLVSNLPALIAQANLRGPVPPLVAFEDFKIVGTGWTNFSGGNSYGAKTDNNRAGQISSSPNEVINTQGIHSTTAPADDYAIDIRLAAPLFGNLDTGTNGAAAYFRIRNTGTWNSGTAVEFRLRGSGAVAISTVSGSTVTQKVTGSGSFTYGSLLRFQAKGNVYSIINLSTNTVILTWTDTAGIVNTGASNRRSTAGQTSNQPLFQPQWCSYAFDSFGITDLSV